MALRSEPMEERLPGFAIVTDASPQGIGAILATVDHNVGQTFTILEALEIPVLEADATWLGVPWKESASQGPLEAWAVKLAFRRWAHRLEGKSVVLRSDSVVALAMTKRLSSPSPVINWIGVELAIRCDKHGIRRIIVQHIPGNWNVEADWLSRPHERSDSKPERLANVPIKRIIPESTWRQPTIVGHFGKSGVGSLRAAVKGWCEKGERAPFSA